MGFPHAGICAPVLVQSIFEIIKDINKKGMTILLVEQNVQMTLKFCNRSYVLENGKISISGTGQELLNNQHVKSAYLGI